MLADLLGYYVTLIAEEITEECDLTPAIDIETLRYLRYHGHAIPDNIECDPNGLLSAWWENLKPKSPGDCAGGLVVTLNAKFAMCWKQADVGQKSMTIHYDQNDSDAARLAQIAECVSRRLLAVVCTQVNAVNEMDDPTAHAFLERGRDMQFLGATPGGAQGGVAWINWRVDTRVIAVPGS